MIRAKRAILRYPPTKEVGGHIKPIPKAKLRSIALKLKYSEPRQELERRWHEFMPGAKPLEIGHLENVAETLAKRRRFEIKEVKKQAEDPDYYKNENELNAEMFEFIMTSAISEIRISPKQWAELKKRISEVSRIIQKFGKFEAHDRILEFSEKVQKIKIPSAGKIDNEITKLKSEMDRIYLLESRARTKTGSRKREISTSQHVLGSGLIFSELFMLYLM